MPSVAQDRARRNVSRLMTRMELAPPQFYRPEADGQPRVKQVHEHARKQDPEHTHYAEREDENELNLEFDPDLDYRGDLEDNQEQALKRSFARYANPQTLNGKRHFHFDDAARKTAPSWPPSFVYDFIRYHFSRAGDHEEGKDTDLSIMPTLQSAYRRVHGLPLHSTTVKAGYAAEGRQYQDPKGRDLDLRGLFALSAAIFSPAYEATFRARLDLALYTALSCATGLESRSFLSVILRWRDFRLWGTNDGLQALYVSPTSLPYRLKDGAMVALSAAKLIAIGMALDGVLAGVSLETITSPAWRAAGAGGERQVPLDSERSNLCVFRGYGAAPASRLDISKEYGRVCRPAGLRTVTTGCFRRLVGAQVSSEYGLEIASHVLGHDTMGQTQRYLECGSETRSHRIRGPHTTTFLPSDTANWEELSPAMRRFIIQPMNCIDPASWRDKCGRRIPLPNTVTTADPLLNELASWMLGPVAAFGGGLSLVSFLEEAQDELADTNIASGGYTQSNASDVNMDGACSSDVLGWHRSGGEFPDWRL